MDRSSNNVRSSSTVTCKRKRVMRVGWMIVALLMIGPSTTWAHDTTRSEVVQQPKRHDEQVMTGGVRTLSVRKQASNEVEALCIVVNQPNYQYQPRPLYYGYLQDLLASFIAVCVAFCAIVVVAITKKPIPRLHDPIPREQLSWAHSDNLFVYTDVSSESIMIKNAGLVDIDMTRCKLQVDSSIDQEIYFTFAFEEGYLAVAGTIVSVCYGTAGKSVYVPRRQVDRLDSRTCPRLRWAAYQDGPVESAIECAALLDERGNRIACESAVLMHASTRRRRLSVDSSDTTLSMASRSSMPAQADWY